MLVNGQLVSKKTGLPASLIITTGMLPTTQGSLLPVGGGGGGGGSRRCRPSLSVASAMIASTKNTRMLLSMLASSAREWTELVAASERSHRARQRCARRSRHAERCCQRADAAHHCRPRHRRCRPSRSPLDGRGRSANEPSAEKSDRRSDRHRGNRDHERCHFATCQKPVGKAIGPTGEASSHYVNESSVPLALCERVTKFLGGDR